ncbi:hypothetical protein JHK87_052298 [Glycine soja]|nr:hypothetical protein JHK87_052298 [Glycine soja]
MPLHTPQRCRKGTLHSGTSPPFETTQTWNRLSSTRGCAGMRECWNRLKALVGFIKQTSHILDSFHLQRNELVYEVVRFVGENYRSVQGEILMCLEQLGGRMMEDVGELNTLVRYLERLGETREKLVLLFLNKRKNNEFWDLVKKTKENGVAKRKEIEGKWLVVVVAGDAPKFTSTMAATSHFECVVPILVSTVVLAEFPKVEWVA